ncbi:hypothetical protein BDZ91DRAFT_736973 [Kalaharituber pfeilii]|nr:hypothetical protein BDZ91DRAFT_736973 [Kalaharituber pfeilii]
MSPVVLADYRSEYNSTLWGTWPPSIPLIFCRDYYNNQLTNSTEFDKWGSACAATVMALLPSLIAFGPLKVADIGLLIHLNAPLGIISAAFTFGFPVDKLSTNRATVYTAKQLMKIDPLLPSPNVPTGIGIVEEARNVTVDLGVVKRKAFEHHRPRHIVVHSVLSLYLFLQLTGVNILVSILPLWDIIYFLWACPQFGAVIFGCWLLVTIIVGGFIRAYFESIQSKTTEILYVSPQKGLRDIGRQTLGSSFWGRILSPHPMIIILRSAKQDQPQNFRTSYLIGTFQLFWLCFVSFMFGSTYGGGLFFTLFMVLTFALVIAVVRVVSIEACGWMEKRLDVVIIEYADEWEKVTIQSHLKEMHEVLIESFAPPSEISRFLQRESTRFANGRELTIHRSCVLRAWRCFLYLSVAVLLIAVIALPIGTSILMADMLPAFIDLEDREFFAPVWKPALAVSFALFGLYHVDMVVNVLW